MPANKTVYIIKDHVGMYYSTGEDGKECWVFGPLNAKQFDTIPKMEFAFRTVEVCELYISYFVKPVKLTLNDWRFRLNEGDQISIKGKNITIWKIQLHPGFEFDITDTDGEEYECQIDDIKHWDEY